MFVLLSFVAVCTSMVRSDYCGMSKLNTSIVLEMVPLAEIQPAAIGLDCNYIPVASASKNNTQDNNNQTLSNHLRGDLPRQYGVDALANDSYIGLELALFPPSQSSIGKESFVQNLQWLHFTSFHLPV